MASFDGKIFKLDRLKFNELYEDAVNYLKDLYKVNNIIYTLASPFGQLLSVILDFGKLVFYYIEDSITELNILTATREVSVKGLATLVGHNPTRAITASGSVLLKFNNTSNSSLFGGKVIIPKFTRLLNKVNGLVYTLKFESDFVVFDLNPSFSLSLNVVQGEFEKQSLVAYGGSLQSFNIPIKSDKLVDNFYVNVYVNDELYKTFDSLYDIPMNYKGCLVKTGVNGGLDIFFGNGNFGYMPDLGSEIRVEYLVTNGVKGNILLSDNFKDWEFIDNGLDVNGDDVNLNELITVVMDRPIIFGTNPESISLTRVLAPKTSRNYVLATLDNYITFLMKFNVFKIVDAFMDLKENLNDIIEDVYYDKNNVVYLFLVPDVSLRMGSSDNYFTVPLSWFKLSDDEKNKIVNLIDSSGMEMIGVDTIIIDPKIKRYILNISLVIFENYNLNFIRESIINKLSDYFLNLSRRDRIPKSDIIKLIEDVDGVDSVNVWFISEETENGKLVDKNYISKDIDEFGDIIIGDRFTLPVVRGGFKDANGVFYNDTVDDGKLGSVNIFVSKITKKQIKV